MIHPLAYNSPHIFLLEVQPLRKPHFTLLFVDECYNYQRASTRHSPSLQKSTMSRDALQQEKVRDHPTSPRHGPPSRLHLAFLVIGQPSDSRLTMSASMIRRGIGTRVVRGCNESKSKPHDSVIPRSYGHVWMIKISRSAIRTTGSCHFSRFFDRKLIRHGTFWTYCTVLGLHFQDKEVLTTGGKRAN